MDGWRRYGKYMLSSIGAGVFLAVAAAQCHAGAVSGSMASHAASSINAIGGHPFSEPPPPPPPPPPPVDAGVPPPPIDVVPPPPVAIGGPPPTATPEPASVTMAVVGVALASAAGWYRRRRQQKDNVAEA